MATHTNKGLLPWWVPWTESRKLTPTAQHFLLQSPARVKTREGRAREGQCKARVQGGEGAGEDRHVLRRCLEGVRSGPAKRRLPEELRALRPSSSHCGRGSGHYHLWLWGYWPLWLPVYLSLLFQAATVRKWR